MEEWVGKLWHNLITHSANREYPQARVHLEEMRKTLGILLRALGNDAGLQIRQSTGVASNTPRSLLQRIAGTGLKTSAAWRETDSLCLPDSIALFPERALNRELYLWLAVTGSGGDYPTWHSRYQRLLTAWQALHPQATDLPLNLIPPPNNQQPATHLSLAEPAPSEPSPSQQQPVTGSSKRHRAERTDMPDGNSGLLSFRLESLFSWTDYIPVDRTAEDAADRWQTQRPRHL